MCESVSEVWKPFLLSLLQNVDCVWISLWGLKTLPFFMTSKCRLCVNQFVRFENLSFLSFSLLRKVCLCVCVCVCVCVFCGVNCLLSFKKILSDVLNQCLLFYLRCFLFCFSVSSCCVMCSSVTKILHFLNQCNILKKNSVCCHVT